VIEFFVGVTGRKTELGVKMRACVVSVGWNRGYNPTSKRFSKSEQTYAQNY